MTGKVGWRGGRGGGGRKRGRPVVPRACERRVCDAIICCRPNKKGGRSFLVVVPLRFPLHPIASLHFLVLSRTSTATRTSSSQPENAAGQRGWRSRGTIDLQPHVGSWKLASAYQYQQTIRRRMKRRVSSGCTVPDVSCVFESEIGSQNEGCFSCD